MYETLISRSIIEISGEDATKFLQNLTTNDLKKTDYCYTYMLSNLGRYLFDFFVYRESDTQFLIDIHRNMAEVFKTHLMTYKLRAKVIINDLSDVYEVIYSKQPIKRKTIISKCDPRYNLLGYRSIIDKNTLPFEGTTHNNKVGLYLEDKYNFTIIDGYEDLIYDKSIPIEYGAEELNSISYDKGCYIGQEVISRTKYQGVVRKKIYKLTAGSNLSTLPKGEMIFVGDKKIGTICSSYANNAIAQIREEDYLQHQNAQITVADINCTLSAPPWRHPEFVSYK